MFIENKYHVWYKAIILRANLRTSCPDYVEIHHIIPHSLGGLDTSENLVELTAREHFICHLLLPKFTSGKERASMIYAMNMMGRCKKSYLHRYFPSSKIYEIMKKLFSEVASSRIKGKTYEELYGKEKAAEMKEGKRQQQIRRNNDPVLGLGKKRALLNKERKGKTYEELYGQEKAAAMREDKRLKGSRKRGKYHTTGIPHPPRTEEHKAKLSKALLGKTKGIPKSEETKQKMRKPKSEAHRKAISEARIAMGISKRLRQVMV